MADAGEGVFEFLTAEDGAATKPMREMRCRWVAGLQRTPFVRRSNIGIWNNLVLRGDGYG